MFIVPPQNECIVKASRDAIAVFSALSNTESGSSDVEQEGLTGHTFANEIQRLKIWIGEHQVASGMLDYKLREAPRLRDQVLSLLLQLSTVGNKTEISESPASTGPWDKINSKAKESDRDTIVTNCTPLETQTGDEQAAESSSSIDTGSTADSLPDTPVERAHDAVTLLLQLGQSLLDPIPHDRSEMSKHPDAAQYDINHIRARFPKAEDFLIERLGTANWERRQSLRNVREALERNPYRVQRKDLDEPVLESVRPEPRESTVASGDEDFASSESSSDVSVDTDSSDNGNISGEGVSRTSSRTMTVTTNARSDFQFSLNDTMSTAITEPSIDVAEIDPAVFEVGEHYQIPQPPSPNENLTGRPFVCPFCSFKISDIKSVSEWKKHVIEDLEPYMCTHKDCIRSAKTYGTRKLWWKHEKQQHRAKHAWICGPCGQNVVFETSVALDEHIIKNHSIKLSSMQLHSIRNACRKDIALSSPSNICPLCQNTIEYKKQSGPKSLEHAVRKHVAGHLEQLAYFVAVPAGEMLLRDDDSELQDDSDSEYGLQSEIESVKSRGTFLSKKQVQIENVNAFIADQRRTVDDAGNAPTIGASGTPERPNVTSLPSSGGHPTAPTFPIQILVHPPNEHFYARESLLTDAYKGLSSSGSLAIFYGVGGVGKTLAAVEYIYTYKQTYDAIFWLQADTKPGLADSYLQMAMSLGLVNGTEDQNHVIDKGRIWLQETKHRWLLVFDNALFWEDIARYMPNSLRKSNGSVLLTTQLQENFLPNANNVTRLRLDPLSQKAGADMLLRYLGRDMRTDPESHLAKEISAFVGGLPVAIGHVAGYVSFSQYTLEELIETFREWRKRSGVATDEADDLPISFREASFSYDGALAMVWEVTLRELSEDAWGLMNILAYLNAASVPQDMLWRVHEDESLQFLDKREKLRAKKIYNSLTKRRLVGVDADSCFFIHRSLQRSIREKLSKNKAKQQNVFDQAVALVREVFPYSNPLQQPTPAKWSECQRLLPHLHSLNEVYHAAKPYIKGSLDFAQLLLDSGMDQFEQGITQEGLHLLHTAEDVLDASSPDEHRAMKADIHAMISMMYDNTGIQQRLDAFKRRQQALSIRMQISEEADPPKHQDEVLLYNSWMDYATSLLHYHRYKQAEPIIEKCLAKFKEWGPEQEIPFEYSKYYNRIALVRMYQGKFNDAISCAEKSVQLMGKTGYGLFMSRFKFDMACIILQSDELDRALQLHKDIYAQRIDMVGMTNELSLHSMYAIGAIYELKGEFYEAERWFRKVLDQRRSVTSWCDEAFSRAQFHMSRVLLACGRPEDVENANSLYQKSLAVLDRLISLDMPRELEGPTDKAILFDHMLPISPGGPRFTGRGLLECFMKST